MAVFNKEEKADIKNFTRGGQITFHNIRMFLQIMNQVLIISGVSSLLIFSVIFYFWVTNYEFYILTEYLISKIIPFFQDNANTVFTQPNGEHIAVSYAEISNSKIIQSIVWNVTKKGIKTLFFSIIFGMLTVFGVSQWLKKRGEKQTEHTLLKGDRILTVSEIRQLIHKQKLGSDLTLAHLPIVKHAETGHFLFNGTTGSGKSNAIKELLDQVRKRGDRAIIYDKSCTFLQEFFDPNKDILLNPLDERSAGWDLWKECRDSVDFDSIAAAQIPMPLSTQDPFWVNAARTIFSATAYEMRNDPDRSISKLLRTILTADLEYIQKYLKGTEAETLVSDKIEKTAVSIKSVLATYLKSLKYVKEGDVSFSVREWIQNENETNWLFVTSLGDRHETLKPLITSWLDIAVNALLSLMANPERRVWLILDELASLQQLPYFTQLLSESRKFGGCVVAGIQNYAQLTKLYGQDGGREISSLFNTRFMFRQPDPEMAKWTASNFGESVMDEVREGMSYGANQIRDGVSINRVESRKPLVSYSEIMSLGNLFAYVRLAGDFPITQVAFEFKKRSSKNIGFLSRNDFDENKMKSMDKLFDECTMKNSDSSMKKLKANRKSNRNVKQHDPIHAFGFD